VIRQLGQAFEKTLGRPSEAAFAHCFFSLVTSPIRRRDTVPARKSDAFLKTCPSWLSALNSKTFHFYI
jgi:hypothetical protein